MDQYVAVWLDGKPRKDSEVYGPFNTEAEAWAYLESRTDIQESYADTGVFLIRNPADN